MKGIFCANLGVNWLYAMRLGLDGIITGNAMFADLFAKMRFFLDPLAQALVLACVVAVNVGRAQRGAIGSRPLSSIARIPAGDRQKAR